MMPFEWGQGPTVHSLSCPAAWSLMAPKHYFGALPSPFPLLSGLSAPPRPPFPSYASDLASNPKSNHPSRPCVMKPCHGGTVLQGPNPYLSHWKGKQEKVEIKERKGLLRMLPQTQHICFRRADATQLLMLFLRGLGKQQGVGDAQARFWCVC